ncbi:MAG: LysR family transcriptional regulator [Acidobacteriota bacterium]
MFDLHRLRILQAVSRYGSLSGAAEALYLTASAVSQQLSKLETEAGQKLLERQGRGVRLTDAASLLVSHADRILSLVEQAEADLEEKKGAVIGSLTLGAFATAARSLLPRVLRDLQDRHPGLAVSLQELEPEHALTGVIRGTLDLSVVVAWANAPMEISDDLTREVLFTDCADLALPLDHPLAERESVSLEEFQDQAWISWPQGSICHHWLVLTLRGLGTEPQIVHTALEHATQVALVEAGLGAAVLPRLGRGPLPEGVRIVPVVPALERQVFAVWRKDAGRRPAITALVDALRHHASHQLVDTEIEQESHQPPS